VSARGVCRACFEAEFGEGRAIQPEEKPTEATVARSPAKTRTTHISLRSFVPRTRSKVIFALVMGCYCISLGSFVSVWAYAAGLPGPPRAFYLRGTTPDVFGLLIFAPLIESLMLVGVFELLRRARAPGWAQVVTSAVFMAELHVFPWWPHGFIVLPSFLIQSGSYSYWRRVSWKDAFWVLVSIHALNNLIPAVSAIGRALRHA
jgi:acetyl esterase/lipase